MSIWTHVVGCIRIDGSDAFGSRVSAVSEVFGPMCLFDNWNEDSTLPRGSEGGLQYHVHQYDEGLPWVAVAVWGDLRDYDDLFEIKKWFTDTLMRFKEQDKARGLMVVRDAVLQARIEGGEYITLTEADVPA